MGALFSCRIDDFAEAEGQIVLVRLDVADVLAVSHVEHESPADDGLQRGRTLPDESVEALSDLPILRGGFSELPENSLIAFFANNAMFLPP